MTDDKERRCAYLHLSYNPLCGMKQQEHKRFVPLNMEINL